VSDDGQLLVDDADDAAARQVRGAQGVLEADKPGTDGEYGAQVAVKVDNRTCEGDDPFLAGAPDNRAADRERVPGADILEIVAVARGKACHLGGPADVRAVERE
jgi:hypothetical protein